MPEKPSHIIDLNETTAAQGAERERVAQEAWADVHDARKVQDEKTERLKAARLARMAEQRG